MGYVENNLVKNEQVIYQVKLSWAKVIVGIFWFPILGFFANLIKRASNHVTLTNQRVVAKKGLINTSSLDTKLEKIQSVTVSSGFFGKLFGYGNITIKTAIDFVTFMDMGGAEMMKRKIMAQMEIVEEENRKAQAREMANAMANVMSNK